MALFTASTLDLADVERALKHHGFELVLTDGPHQHWLGEIDGEVRVVTVDMDDAPFTPAHGSIGGIIRQSGIPKRIFYWAAGKPLPWAGQP